MIFISWKSSGGHFLNHINYTSHGNTRSWCKSNGKLALIFVQPLPQETNYVVLPGVAVKEPCPVKFIAQLNCPNFGSQKCGTIR